MIIKAEEEFDSVRYIFEFKKSEINILNLSKQDLDLIKIANQAPLNIINVVRVIFMLNFKQEQTKVQDLEDWWKFVDPKELKIMEEDRMEREDFFRKIYLNEPPQGENNNE